MVSGYSSIFDDLANFFEKLYLCQAIGNLTFPGWNGLYMIVCYGSLYHINACNQRRIDYHCLHTTRDRVVPFTWAEERREREEEREDRIKKIRVRREGKRKEEKGKEKKRRKRKERRKEWREEKEERGERKVPRGEGRKDRAGRKRTRIEIEEDRDRRGRRQT